MNANSSPSAEKIFSLSQESFRRELGRSGYAEGGDAGRSGQAIVSRLRQVADASRRNEERAKAQTQALTAQLQAAEGRIEELAAAVQQAEHRALEAEEWLERVLREAQEIFDGGSAR